MPIRKKQFTIVQEDLQKVIDVDASDGRSVPVNMNFIDQGYLTKDTGFTIFGSATDVKRHSIFNYKKKDGTSYILGIRGTKMQRYYELDREWSDLSNSPTLTEDAEVGYYVYDNNLYFGNAVESLYKFDGTTFTAYPSAPKGNILEIFEDRLFITGVVAEPLSIYYSNVGVPTTFSGTDVVKPLGTDRVVSLKNYYGALLIFKQKSIWKLTFIYDQIVNLFVPKLEAQSGSYGACSRKAVTWVENDLWFFTGREVRSIGFIDNITGVFGINQSVISENIKETLNLIDESNYDKCLTAYNDSRFYLGVPIDIDTNDTMFICHLLYNKSWTKYTGRTKATVSDFMFIDEIPYTASSSFPYGVVKWKVEAGDKVDINNNLIAEQEI